MKVWISQGIRSDHSSNKKSDSHCIYYKNLYFKITDIRLLDECITFDLKLSNKLCSVSPQDVFAIFSDNFELRLDWK